MIVSGSGVSVYPPIEEIKVNIGEKGTPIVPGLGKEYYAASYRGKIVGWRIVGQPSGSVEVDILKTHDSIPTTLDSITGSEIPSLVNQQINSDTELTTWTTEVEPGDIFGVNILSATDVENLVLTISIIQA